MTPALPAHAPIALLQLLTVVLGLALKLDVPTAAFVVNGVAVFLAALLSWKYDTMLMWLTPDGRRLILDV